MAPLAAMLRSMLARGRYARLVLAVVVVVSGLFGGWWFSSGAQETNDTSTLRTSPVERRGLVEVVEATGRLEAEHAVIVTAAASGQLIEILVSSGQKVSKSQILGRLDARRLDLDVEALKATQLVAEAKVAEASVSAQQAKAQFARLQRLASRSKSSDARLEAARAERTRALAQQRAAHAELAAATARLSAGMMAQEGAEVRAPIAGIVLRTPDKAGMPVQPSGPILFELADHLDPLQLRVEIGEAEVGRLSVGQRALFEVPAYAGHSFEAQVVRIGMVANRVGGLSKYPVFLRAPNGSGELLRPGMTADVRFEVAEAEDALVVRDAALRYQPKGLASAPPRSRVFVVRGEEVQAVAITTGLSDGAYTEVKPQAKDALRPGDRVVIGGQAQGLIRASRLSLGGGGG